MRGAATALNNLLRCSNSGPQLLWLILMIAEAILVSFLTMRFKCARNFMSFSKMTSRYLASLAGLMMKSFNRIDASVGFLLLVKWINMYLDFSNWASCLRLHISALASIFFSFSAFSAAESPFTSYAMSFMNPSSSSYWLSMLSKLLLYTSRSA